MTRASSVSVDGMWRAFALQDGQEGTCMKSSGMTCSGQRCIQCVKKIALVDSDSLNENEARFYKGYTCIIQHHIPYIISTAGRCVTSAVVELLWLMHPI